MLTHFTPHYRLLTMKVLCIPRAEGVFVSNSVSLRNLPLRTNTL